MQSRLQRYTLKMPKLGKVTSLPDYAIPAGAFYDISNFMYNLQGALGLMPGWALFKAVRTYPVMLIEQYFTNDGSNFLVAFDTKCGYVYNTGTAVFDTIDGSGNFTGDYTYNFSAAVWPAAGAELLLVTNGKDVVKKWDSPAALTALGGLTDAEPGGVTVSTAKVVRVFDDFVLLMHTTEAGNVLPSRVRWGKKGYPEIWKNDTDGLGEAGFTDLTETTDWIVTAERLNYNMVIYKERSVYLQEYVGSPTVMRFTRYLDGIGVLGPNCVAVRPDSHFIIGNDNFYQIATSSFDPIGDQIKEEFFGLLNPDRHNQIKMTVVEERNEIIVAFPSVSSDTADMFYVYNYMQRNWTGPHTRACTSFGKYRSASDITWANLSGAWSVQVGYWDERVFQANTPLTLMGNYSGNIYTLHSGITAAGTAINGYFTTGLTDLDKPEVIKRLQKLWVAIDGAVSGSVTLYVGFTDNPDTAIQWYGPITKAVGGSTLEFDVDVTAKYFKYKFATVIGAPFNFLGATAGFIVREGTR